MPKLKLPPGVVPFPVGAKITVKNEVIICTSLSNVLKDETDTTLRTVKIGYYDAESKGMYPIVEEYRKYIKPAYETPDGVTPLNGNSPSPVSARYRLENGRGNASGNKKTEAEIKEARESDREVDVPGYAYISPTGRVCMYRFDSPYEENKNKEDTIHIGEYDDETGRMMVRWAYCMYVDKNWKRKGNYMRVEPDSLVPENAGEVDIPDFAYRTQYDYRLTYLIYIREKDSPYPEYKDSDKYVYIGRMNPQTKKLKPEANYYRYLDRQPGVIYPDNRYMVDKDKPIQAPPEARHWKKGGYHIQRSVAVNAGMWGQGAVLVGTDSDTEGMMIPTSDYEAACIPDAPMTRRQIYGFVDKTMKEYREEERLQQLRLFDDLCLMVSPGYSLIAHRFFVDSGIEQILKDVYGPVAANRIEVLACEHARCGNSVINCEYSDIYMPLFRVNMDTGSTMELYDRITAHGTKPFYDRWMALHPDCNPIMFPVFGRLEVYGTESMRGSRYWDCMVQDEEFGLIEPIVFYDWNTNHYLWYETENLNEWYKDGFLLFDDPIDTLPYTSLKKAKAWFPFYSHENWDGMKGEYEKRGEITVSLWPLDQEVEPYFKKVEGKLFSEEYRLERFDEYVTIQDCEIQGIKGRLLIGLSHYHRENLLKYGAHEYLMALRRGLSNESKTDALYHRYAKYFSFEDGGESDNFFHPHSYPCTAKIRKGATKSFEREAGYYVVFTTNQTLSVDELVRMHYQMNVNGGFFFGRYHASEFENCENRLKKSMQAVYLVKMIARNLQAHISEVFAFDPRNLDYEQQMELLTNPRVKWNAGKPALRDELSEDSRRMFAAFNVTEDDLVEYAKRCYQTDHYFSADYGKADTYGRRELPDDYEWDLYDKDYLGTDKDAVRNIPPRCFEEFFII